VVILKADFGDIQKEILILSGIGIVTFSFAVPIFKKLITR
jgi:hypothetical protein